MLVIIFMYRYLTGGESKAIIPATNIAEIGGGQFFSFLRSFCCDVHFIYTHKEPSKSNRLLVLRRHRNSTIENNGAAFNFRHETLQSDFVCVRLCGAIMGRISHNKCRQSMSNPPTPVETKFVQPFSILFMDMMRFAKLMKKSEEEKEEQSASHTHMTFFWASSRLDCCFLSSGLRRCHQNVH